MNFRGDDPVYPRLSDPESTAVFRQNVTRGAASAWVTNTYGNADGTIRVYYSYGNHYIDDPNHFHSLDDRFGVMAYENFNPWTGAAMTVGFDFDRYSGKIPMSGGKPYDPGSMQTIARKITNEYSPYLTLSQSFIGEMLVINAGVRMANSDRFGTQWVPQAGIVFNHPEGWTAKASAAMGYRTPPSASSISTAWQTPTSSRKRCGIMRCRSPKASRIGSRLASLLIIHAVTT